ncbi:conserved hypothetical protein [Candidatus Terasakiella magnetica]|nr:conserved hypothetical protein [Candidatus Terasakiella magnetica]
MLSPTTTGGQIPTAVSAVQIARVLEDLAAKAWSAGFKGLAESIASVGIEACEEARHASRLQI